MKPFFTQKLLEWNNKENTRSMPWKGEQDPYKIWLSEIILQQTRVEQGWDYYLRFVKAFPTVHKLAVAPEATVFKLWEGLGYYSRCKNLITSAKMIDQSYNGSFPTTYESILALKGVGPYTAAAIASFAFNLPHAVVDGNVARIIARVFGIETPIDSTTGKYIINDLAAELLDKKKPGVYNQAIMDFGAVICKPQVPLCEACIMQSKCIAFKKGLVQLLPVKEKKIVKKNRWFYYLIITHKKQVYIKKRSGKDIWQNLYEFFLVENDKALNVEEIQQHQYVKPLFKQNKATITSVSRAYSQQLTHQTLHGMFIELIVSSAPQLGEDFIKVAFEDLEQYPFPKFIITYLQEKNVNLSQR
ncbi:MAG: A/G-specific adenine glycosylase [Agriterribacter sp.]